MAALRKPAPAIQELQPEMELTNKTAFAFSSRSPADIDAALRAYFKKAAESGDDQQASLDELMNAVDDSRPPGQKIFPCR
jgi:hypothetical protein